MTKIADNFSGYLNVEDDVFAYNVSNHAVTLLPAQSERAEQYQVFRRICSRNIDSPEYLFGDNHNSRIAMLHNGIFGFDLFGLDPSVKFIAPIIIEATGNTESFLNMLTQDWDRFHAITFCGGSINALCNPKMAIEEPRMDEYLKKDGARSVKIRPWSDYTRSVDFEIDGEKVTLTISTILQAGEEDHTEHMGSYSIGKLDSFIRLSFENAQSFDEIVKYYKIVKSLTAILTMQNNVFFEVYLSQKNSDNKYFKTGVCKILDHYENYVERTYYNVIHIYDIFEYIPSLIDRIANNDVDTLLVLLPEDNRKADRISIKNVQDLCTALEVAYDCRKNNKEKDNLIEELKKNIKEVIAKFIENHNEFDVYKKTTISSAFQYLDYTLKQKILTLYNGNCNMIDAIISKRSLPQVNEENVASFVKLRNNKTHSGIVEWGDSANLYTAFLALEYTCLFRYIEMPNEIIKAALLQIF